MKCIGQNVEVVPGHLVGGTVMMIEKGINGSGRILQVLIDVGNLVLMQEILQNIITERLAHIKDQEKVDHRVLGFTAGIKILKMASTEETMIGGMRLAHIKDQGKVDHPVPGFTAGLKTLRIALIEEMTIGEMNVMIGQEMKNNVVIMIGKSLIGDETLHLILLQKECQLVNIKTSMDQILLILRKNTSTKLLK